MRAAVAAVAAIAAAVAAACAPGSLDAVDGSTLDAATDAADPRADAGSTASPLFVAVGYAGRRVVSRDGLEWTYDLQEPGPGLDDDQNLRGACFGDGVFVAVGGSLRGRVMTTRDGASWTERWDDLSWIGGCAFGDGVFVAVGGGRSLRSVDGGATWIDLQSHSWWGMRDVAFGDGLFVAVGDAGALAVSPDGVSWDVRPPLGGSLRRIAHGAGRFVATGTDRIASSSDGLTWIETPLAEVGAPAFGDGMFVVTGERAVWTSSDGVAWSQHAAPAMGALAWGQGAWIATRWPNERRRSLDGLEWMAVASDGGSALGDVVFGVTTP